MVSKFILALAAVAAFAVAGTSASDPIVGNFKLADPSQLQSPDLEKLLKVIEIGAADIEKVRKASNVDIEVKKEGAGYHYTIKGLVGDAKIDKSFVSGQEYSNKRFDGKEYKGKITVIGRSGIRQADYGAFKSHYVATFCPDGMELLLTAEKGADFAKSRINFKRDYHY